MGFSLQYRTTKLVGHKKAEAIRDAADAANEGRTWLECEPVGFYAGLDWGHLCGSSKPNFLPNSQDATAAANSGLPGGTVRDMLDVLCALSRDHGVDWVLSHDHNPNIGYIRAGVCDRKLLGQIEGLAELGDILSEFGQD